MWDNSAPIYGSLAGIERRRLRWTQIQLLKTVIAAITTSEESAELASPNNDDAIKTSYFIDSAIYALLPTPTGGENSSQDSHPDHFVGDGEAAGGISLSDRRGIFRRHTLR
jgi:hypothetical protein